MHGPNQPIYIYSDAKAFLDSQGEIEPNAIEKPNELDVPAFKGALEQLQEKGWNLAQMEVKMLIGVDKHEIHNAAAFLNS